LLVELGAMAERTGKSGRVQVGHAASVADRCQPVPRDYRDG
jgi:hypothetical protein